VPLKIMYPGADIPALQLSLPTSDPTRLLALGVRLRELREEGVLVIGSGFTTHGLPFLTRDDFLGKTTPGWSQDFDGWAAEALARGDVDELAVGDRIVDAAKEAAIAFVNTRSSGIDPKLSMTTGFCPMTSIA